MSGTTIKHLFTKAQAIAFIKKADREKAGPFYVSIRLDAQIEGQENKVFEGGLSHYLELSKAKAMKVVQGMLSDALEERGARIRIEEHHMELAGRTAVSFWIC